jgi:hypothetical protein
MRPTVLALISLFVWSGVALLAGTAVWVFTAVLMVLFSLWMWARLAETADEILLFGGIGMLYIGLFFAALVAVHDEFASAVNLWPFLLLCGLCGGNFLYGWWKGNGAE